MRVFGVTVLLFLLALLATLRQVLAQLKQLPHSEPILSVSLSAFIVAAPSSTA